MLTNDYPTRRGSLRFITFESRLLQNNRYGDAVLRHHPVYLPPSYDHPEQAERRYPVVYMLAGYTGSGLHLFGPGTFTETLSDRIDRLIEAGMPEVIVVAPDCMTRLGGSQYVNGAAGPYEDYLVQEVLPQAQSDLRTTAESAGSGVMGKSSGGFGALHLAMGHPRLFPAVACHSGDAYFDVSVRGDFATLVNALDRFEGDESNKIAAFLQHFERAVKNSYSDGHALMTLACSAAYSPNPQTPHGFDLPCDPHTGELRPEVWKRWLAYDPIERVSDSATALRRLRLLFIDCGTRDQYALHLGARILHHRLEQHKVAHEYEEFDDDHSGIQYRWDVSLPKIVSALEMARS